MTKKLDKIEILAMISVKQKSHFMWTEKRLDVLGWSSNFLRFSEWNAKVNSQNGKLEDYT